MGVADLTADLQFCDEWTAGRANAIKEEKTRGPGESACTRRGIDARLGASHATCKVKEVNGRFTVFPCSDRLYWTGICAGGR
jgi:hypothetical protein